MIRFFNIIVLCLAFAVTPVAHAADLEEARVYLTSGDYDLAFSQAQIVGDVPGILLAVEALNSKILIGNSDNVKKDAKLAMKMAQQVLELDPDNKDAKLLYAIAYGFYGRSASPFKAWRKKLPQKIRAAIDQAYAANPGEPHSYALIGAWHLSIHARAGASTAKRLYGASKEQGIAFYKKALEAAPQDILITGNYALMLYASDPERHEDEVRQLLTDIQSATPKDATEEQILTILADINKQLDQPDIAKSSAEAFLDW